MKITFLTVINIVVVLTNCGRANGGDFGLQDDPAGKGGDKIKLFNPFFEARITEPNFVAICHAVKQQWGKDKPTEPHFKRACNFAFQKLMQNKQQREIWLNKLKYESEILEEELKDAKLGNDDPDSLQAKAMRTKSAQAQNADLYAKLIEATIASQNPDQLLQRELLDTKIQTEIGEIEDALNSKLYRALG